MELILIEDVPHLGAIGALVKVAPGYGRNYLLPKRMAVLASAKSKREVEHNKRVANFRRQKARAESEGVAKKLATMDVSIARKVGDQEKLFGSVTAHDVQAALAAKGVEVDRRKLDLHEPIKTLGEFKVNLRLSGDVPATVTVKVVAE